MNTCPSRTSTTSRTGYGSSSKAASGLSPRESNGPRLTAIAPRPGQVASVRGRPADDLTCAGCTAATVDELTSHVRGYRVPSCATDRRKCTAGPSPAGGRAVLRPADGATMVAKPWCSRSFAGFRRAHFRLDLRERTVANVQEPPPAALAVWGSGVRVPSAPPRRPGRSPTRRAA